MTKRICTNGFLLGILVMLVSGPISGQSCVPWDRFSRQPDTVNQGYYLSKTTHELIMWPDDWMDFEDIFGEGEKWPVEKCTILLGTSLVRWVECWPEFLTPEPSEGMWQQTVWKEGQAHEDGKCLMVLGVLADYTFNI